MKNSTIVKTLILTSILLPLFWYFTWVMIKITIIISLMCLFGYIVFSLADCLEDYYYPMIKKEYNLFYNLGRFFKWLDSKPRVIKPSKKEWRTPDDWDGEL
jgi:hypothetical protein